MSSDTLVKRGAELFNRPPSGGEAAMAVAEA